MAKEKIDGKTILYTKLQIIADRNERFAMISEELSTLRTDVDTKIEKLKRISKRNNQNSTDA